MAIVPNLHLHRDCERAIQLYRRAFGAEVKALLRYCDADPQDGVYGEEYANLVYHAELNICGQRVTMSDSLSPDPRAGNTVSLMLTMENVQSARRAYNCLADSAQIITAPCDTTYSAFFASLVDACGVRWELICER